MPSSLVTWAKGQMTPLSVGAPGGEASRDSARDARARSTDGTCACNTLSALCPRPALPSALLHIMGPGGGHGALAGPGGTGHRRPSRPPHPTPCAALTRRDLLSIYKATASRSLILLVRKRKWRLRQAQSLDSELLLAGFFPPIPSTLSFFSKMSVHFLILPLVKNQRSKRFLTRACDYSETVVCTARCRASCFTVSMKGPPASHAAGKGPPRSPGYRPGGDK